MSADTPPLASLLLASAAAGVALHQFFKNFELDRFPLSILGAVIASHWALAYGLQQASAQPASFWASQRLALCVVAVAVLSLWANMLVYRAFFHPLNRFPGPFGAKLTKLWSLKKVHESDTKWFRVAGALHEQYGDYVRTGPRELSVLDPAALVPMLGARMEKGPFYGALEKSMHTNRDYEFQRKRRKVWDMAFKQTLEDYGPSIEEFTDTLLTRIDSAAGAPVVINDLAIHYSYDVMSALAFGTSTHFIEGKSTEIATRILKSITDGVVAVGFCMHAAWFLTIVETLSFAGPMKMWKLWCAEQVAARRKMQNTRPDIMGYLLEHTEDTREGRRLLNAESRLLISAGSDTTTTALSTVFPLLAHYPAYQQLLREEVARSFADGSYTCARPQSLLDGVINETLRLCPPILFGTQRMVPKGGIRIGDVEIPQDTVLCFGAYHYHHDKRNFVDPDSFIPERWTTRPELVLNKEAFITFSKGPYKCPGRVLAMMELRSVVAKAVGRYDIAFPAGAQFDCEKYFGGFIDHFTTGVPRQELVFTLREDAVAA